MKIFCLGQKNFQQRFAKLKYWRLQSSCLKMSRYSLFCVYLTGDFGEVTYENHNRIYSEHGG